MEIPVALRTFAGPALAGGAVGGVLVLAWPSAIRCATGTPLTVARLRLPRPGPAAVR